MMALDSENTLDKWPLPGYGDFIFHCLACDVKEVFVTGTNTDPLLYKHTPSLVAVTKYLLGVPVGVRTNGIADNTEAWQCYDKASITICSFDDAINRKMMGGPALSTGRLHELLGEKADVKINIVLGPENVGTKDIFKTLYFLEKWGPRRVNLREPYGQPFVGDPMAKMRDPIKHVHGMPVYQYGPLQVCYWNVHYCEVESVNLYASGRVSLTYPITKGHADDGEVHEQAHFPGGRIREQWVKLEKKIPRVT